LCSNQIGYNADEPFHEFKKLQRDALKAGRSHFKTQLQNIASYINIHGDFSDPTDSEAKDPFARNDGKIDFVTENRRFKRNHPITFDKSDYEAFSRVNVHYFGFRITPEYINEQVAVRVKPKIRYAALRHSLEMTLHMWSADYRNDEDAMCAVGPNGISF
jgi:hypothetical protein